MVLRGIGYRIESFGRSLNHLFLAMRWIEAARPVRCLGRRVFAE